MSFDRRRDFFTTTWPGRGSSAASAGRCRVATHPAALTAALIATFIVPPNVMFGNEVYDLSPVGNGGETVRVRCVLEVTGELKLNASGKGVTRLPLRVKGEISYDERTIDAGRQRTRLKNVRLYEQARATIQVGETATQSELRPDCRLIVADASAGHLVLFSPLGPLTRDELELLDVPGSSALVAGLLPEKPVAVGERWSPAPEVLAGLLGLDAVTQARVESGLQQVDDKRAVLAIKGTVSGAVRGISSDIELDGRCDFDMAQRRITWLAMSIRETRAVGHAEPGLEAVARLRMGIAPGKPCAEISEATLAHVPLEANPGTLLLRLASPEGKYQLLYGRQWRVMLDRHDVTVLRLVDQGDLIAQCNASRLPDLPPGQHVQLEAFQADVQQSLGKSFGDFVEASQTVSDRGIRVLRAVVSGVASEMPIQWTYYHFSDARGRQLAMVFTTDARLVERFAGADQPLVSSFEFADHPRGSAGGEASTADR